MKKLLPILFLAIFISSVWGENLKVKSGSVTICGTLESPDTNAAVPVVLIIAGSGPTDKDGNSPLIPGKNNSLKYLAEGLLKEGVASFRYNKRFLGECAQKDFKESDLTFDTLVNDAVNCIKYLKQDKRFSKVYVFGHSEGSLIGMIAAQEAGADGFISAAGAGYPADDIIKAQLQRGGAPKEIMDNVLTTLDSLKAGHMVNKIDPNLYALFRASVQPYMISWFKYDPSKEIAKLKAPVLIVQGTHDIQVTTDNADTLKAAKPEAQLIMITNMNHVFKIVESEDVSMNVKAYSDETLPVAPELVDAVTKFVKE